MKNSKFVNKIQKFSFCYRYIPNKALIFHDIGYHEPACKIFENKNFKSKSKYIYYSLSIGLYSTLVFNPYAYMGINYLNWISNILLQPSLYLKLKKDEKNLSIYVKQIFILKNGKQILIITQDESICVLNISDINKVEEDESRDVFVINTEDKEFIVDLKNSKNENFNRDIFDALKEQRNVNTRSSYTNYNRLTIQKYYDI
jgi:hypothetical protein